MSGGRWWVDALAGGIAGAGATWLMDRVTTAMLDAQRAEVTAREQAARPNDRGAVANLVARLEAALGLELDDGERASLQQVVHYGLGIGPAIVYAMLRRRVPLVAAANGALFGLAVWALDDEYLNARLGLSAPIDAYPFETHLRGAVGHVVLGMSMDTGLDLLGR
jgi:hypothetical protein